MIYFFACVSSQCYKCNPNELYACCVLRHNFIGAMNITVVREREASLCGEV
jgi:hypothetical protein